MKLLVQKLTSRKFWLGTAVLIVGVVLCCFGDLTNGMTLISIGCLGYLGAEGLVDIFRIVFSCSFFNEQVQQERAEAAAENPADSETTAGESAAAYHYDSAAAPAAGTDGAGTGADTDDAGTGGGGDG